MLKAETVRWFRFQFDKVSFSSQAVYRHHFAQFFARGGRMTAIRGSAAAVTGAAGGIGRALALELAARGADLALADRDEAGLASVAAEIGATRKVTVHRVDIGEANEIAQFA